jgi:cell fate regulator YaaT (PSP1 superfamily)
MLGLFSFADTQLFRHGHRVVVRTPRGQEAGTVLCEATHDAVESLREHKVELIEERIIRLMTPNDETEYRGILVRENAEFDQIRAIIKSMELAMNLVRVEHLFGGERLMVYYTADGRVDFRELVKVLAGTFQIRVEMRQIGVRDETKLLAEVGDCGRKICCNSHLIEIPPVSMKMAKLQKATLDPNKISGHCSRLKCCLRYEYDQYTTEPHLMKDKDEIDED